MVKNGVRVDVEPFLASSVKNRWWDGPAGAQAGEEPIMYHTHLHKCAGTLICQMASAAFKSRASHRNYNCNVPKQFWGCQGPPDPYEKVRICRLPPPPTPLPLSLHQPPTGPSPPAAHPLCTPDPPPSFCLVHMIVGALGIWVIRGQLKGCCEGGGAGGVTYR